MIINRTIHAWTFLDAPVEDPAILGFASKDAVSHSAQTFLIVDPIRCALRGSVLRLATPSVTVRWDHILTVETRSVGNCLNSMMKIRKE